MRFLFVILFMVLATHVNAQESQRVAGESPSVKKQQSDEADSGTQTPQPKGFPVTIVETPEQASDSAGREAKTDKHEAADLYAQVRAANAAERAAATAERQEIPAWTQIIIGGMSTFFALIALGVSILTAVWAIKTTRGSSGLRPRRKR